VKSSSAAASASIVRQRSKKWRIVAASGSATMRSPVA
jgi:hypothetical protein